MKQEYIVIGKGQISQEKVTKYDVVANSCEEAVQIAQERFKNRYSIIDGDFQATAQKRKQYIRIISMLLLIVACVLSFKGFIDVTEVPEKVTKGFWLWKKETIEYTQKIGSVQHFRPNANSVFFSFLIFGIYAIKIKGINNLVNNVIDILHIALVIFTLAALLIPFLNNPDPTSTGFLATLKEWLDPFSEIKKIKPEVVLVFLIVCGYCGMKFISGVCLITYLIMALSNLSVISDKTGLIGTFFTLTALLGLLLYVIDDTNLINKLQSVS